MSDNDRDLEDVSADESWFKDAYDALKAPEVPSELDAAVLANARQAIRNPWQTRVQRWRWPLATAASLLIMTVAILPMVDEVVAPLPIAPTESAPASESLVLDIPQPGTARQVKARRAPAAVAGMPVPPELNAPYEEPVVVSAQATDQSYRESTEIAELGSPPVKRQAVLQAPQLEPAAEYQSVSPDAVRTSRRLAADSAAESYGAVAAAVPPPAEVANDGAPVRATLFDVGDRAESLADERAPAGTEQGAGHVLEEVIVTSQQRATHRGDRASHWRERACTHWRGRWFPAPAQPADMEACAARRRVTLRLIMAVSAGADVETRVPTAGRGEVTVDRGLHCDAVVVSDAATRRRFAIRDDEWVELDDAGWSMCSPERHSEH